MNTIGTNIMMNFKQDEMERIEAYNKRNGKADYEWFKDLILEEITKDEIKHESLNICPKCGKIIVGAVSRISDEKGEKYHLECWYAK